MQGIEQHRQAIIHRFMAACHADERVVAAFLGGSYAREATDAYSDIDFGLINRDEAYDDFFADREVFIRLLGEPIFLEVFSDYEFDIVFFTFPDGVECELVPGRESQVNHIRRKPSLTLRSSLCQTWNVVTWRCWSPECLPCEKALSRRNKDVIYSSIG